MGLDSPGGVSCTTDAFETPIYSFVQPRAPQTTNGGSAAGAGSWLAARMAGARIIHRRATKDLQAAFQEHPRNILMWEILMLLVHQHPKVIIPEIIVSTE